MYNNYISEDTYYNKINKNPVYVVLMNGGTPLSKIISGFTGDTYTHACIAFNAKLKPLYSFGLTSESTFGFAVADTKDRKAFPHIDKYAVYVMYVSNHQLYKMKKRLKWFMDNKDNLKFDFPALVSVFFQKDTENHTDKYFCSRFVSEILKIGEVDLQKKASLYRPESLLELSNISLVNWGRDILHYNWIKTRDNERLIKANKYVNPKNLIPKFESGRDDLYEETHWDTLLTKPKLYFNKKVTMYHYSNANKDIVVPLTVNAGNKLAKPRFSSWWTPYKSNAGWALSYVIFNTFKESKWKDVLWHVETMTIDGMTYRAPRTIISESFYKSHEDFIKSIDVYEHQKTFNGSDLGRGNEYSVDEYTCDFAVKPDRVRRISWDEMLEIIKIVPDDEFQLYRKELNDMWVHGKTFQDLVHEKKPWLYWEMDVTKDIRDRYCKEHNIQFKIDEEYFRFTYHGGGIYEALKQHVSHNVWRRLLTSSNFKWLPKPDYYSDTCTSWFTKEGKDKFVKKVLPICEKYLGDEIEYTKAKDLKNIVYKDRYQVVVDPVRNTNESVNYDELYTHESKQNISYSKSFKDVKNVVDSLTKKELSNICNGAFKDSPYVVYRNVLIYDNDPAAFIDVYKLDDSDDNDGCIVIACKKEYRGMGFPTQLIDELKKDKSFKWSHLVWECAKNNVASSTLAKKIGLKLTNQSGKKYEYSMYNESVIYDDRDFDDILEEDSKYDYDSHLYGKEYARNLHKVDILKTRLKQGKITQEEFDKEYEKIKPSGRFKIKPSKDGAEKVEYKRPNKNKPEGSAKKLYKGETGSRVDGDLSKSDGEKFDHYNNILQRTENYNDYKTAFRNMARLLGKPNASAIKVDPDSFEGHVNARCYTSKKSANCTADTKLYHTSETKGLTRLNGKFRSKDGICYSSKRVYFHKGKPGSRMGESPSIEKNEYVYEFIGNPSQAYVDPELNGTAVFIETDTSVPVKDVTDQFKNKEVKESADKSELIPNFKKKSGINFEIIDIHNIRAKKYLRSDKSLCKNMDFINKARTGEIAIDKRRDKLAGYIFVSKTGTIQPIHIYGNYRGYGLSETLLKDGIQKYHATNLGVYSDNQVAINLYKKFGFKQTKEKNYKDGEKVIFMELDDKSLKKESVLTESKSNNQIYFISDKNMDGKVLSPRIPDNYFTRHGHEDTKTKRVCFAPSINKSLMALSNNIIGKEFYVHIAIGEYKVYKPTVKQVPDSKVTGELWVTKPVKVSCIGKIKVISDMGLSGHKFSYGDKEAELYDWKYEWVERLNSMVESCNTLDIYITESNQKSTVLLDFKKKSGIKFAFIDIHDIRAKKYLDKNSFYKKNFKKIISITNGEIAVDADNDKLAGYIYVGAGKKGQDKNYGFIQTLEVLKQYRGYGLSNNLLDDAIKKYNAVDLTVYKDNEVALKLYKKHGFVIIGYGNSKDKSDYWMKLKTKLTKDEKIMNEAGRITMESTLLESTKSSVDPNYKPKGKIKLSSLKRVRITESVINKYKKEYPFLKHVRCADTKEYVCDGYIWFDDDNLVAMVGSCEYTDDKTKWVVSLEITKDYKGYGLSPQILDYATKTMKCKYLSVNKNNKLAKKIYDDYGFKVYEESESMYYMTIDNNRKRTMEYTLLESSNNSLLDDIIAFNAKTNVMEYIIPNNGNIITNVTGDSFINNYKVLTPKEFEKYNGGVCWDYVIYEANYFNKNFRNVKYKTFFHCCVDGNMNPTHTFLLFYLSGKVYWFESSWKDHRGIYEFKNENEALSYISKELYDYLDDVTKKNVTEIFLTSYNPLDNNMYGMTCEEYMNYMSIKPSYNYTKKSNPKYLNKYIGKEAFDISQHITESTYEAIEEACKNPREARRFVQDVEKLAKKYNANYFLVTDGASGTNNKDNKAVKYCRDALKEWERKNKFNPDEDWRKNPDDFSDYKLEETMLYEFANKELLDKIHVTSDVELSKWMKSNIKYQEFKTLMTPEEVFESRRGSCHDQVVFELAVLKALKYSPKTLFFIEYNDGETVGGQTHSLVYYRRGNNFFWFENAWGDQAGIHGPYKNVTEIKNDIISKHDTKKYKKLQFSSFRGKAGMTLDELVKACLK